MQIANHLLRKKGYPYPQLARKLPPCAPKTQLAQLAQKYLPCAPRTQPALLHKQKARIIIKGEKKLLSKHHSIDLDL